MDLFNVEPMTPIQEILRPLVILIHARDYIWRTETDAKLKLDAVEILRIAITQI